MTSPSRTDTMNLNLFYVPRGGHHSAAWRVMKAPPASERALASLLESARLAEAGTFDSVFMADVLHLGGGVEFGPPSFHEPLTALGALASATTHIGLIGTVSTTYDQAFHIARRFASLDHLSGGRAGWNVVTSRHDAEAANFGIEHHPEHDDRYERAGQTLEAVLSLWDSWADDAISPDLTAGTFVRKDRVWPVAAEVAGRRIAGPLNIPRPPQGHPVIVQAGGSDRGRDLAAQYADALFTVQPSLEGSRAFVADIRERVRKQGRDPAALRVLPGFYVLVGSTHEEVRRRQAELDEATDVTRELTWLRQFLGVDTLDGDLDRPLRDLPAADQIRTSRSFFEVISERAQDMTLRSLLRSVAAGSGHHQVAGVPEEIAGEMERWFLAGAADGFNLKPALMSADLPAVVGHVVPLLRKRGLFRREYTGSTLRDHLGLSRPALRSPARA